MRKSKRYENTIHTYPLANDTILLDENTEIETKIVQCTIECGTVSMPIFVTTLRSTILCIMWCMHKYCLSILYRNRSIFHSDSAYNTWHKTLTSSYRIHLHLSSQTVRLSNIIFFLCCCWFISLALVSGIYFIVESFHYFVHQFLWENSVESVVPKIQISVSFTKEQAETKMMCKKERKSECEKLVFVVQQFHMRNIISKTIFFVFELKFFIDIFLFRWALVI